MWEGKETRSAQNQGCRSVNQSPSVPVYPQEGGRVRGPVYPDPHRGNLSSDVPVYPREGGGEGGPVYRWRSAPRVSRSTRPSGPLGAGRPGHPPSAGPALCSFRGGGVARSTALPEHPRRPGTSLPRGTPPPAARGPHARDRPEGARRHLPARWLPGQPGGGADKSLCRGMTFNRSQRGSCSATYETLTQNQVVYE